MGYNHCNWTFRQYKTESGHTANRRRCQSSQSVRAHTVLDKVDGSQGESGTPPVWVWTVGVKLFLRVYVVFISQLTNKLYFMNKAAQQQCSASD